MIVMHKNSKEVFNLNKPRSYKSNGVYGLLVMGNKNVFFITEAQEGDYECVTENFEIIKDLKLWKLN